MINGYEKFEYKKDVLPDIEYNLHSHNYLCGHARGTVSDYVSEACRNHMKCIGISDHIGQPGHFNPYVKFEDFDQKYLSQFAVAERDFGDKIKICVGGEIEYTPENIGYYEKLLTKLDYLILGQHVFRHNGKTLNSFFDGNTEDKVLSYIKQVKEGVSTGLFAILGHPDVILSAGIVPTDNIKTAFSDLIKTVRNKGVLVELNANGIRNNGFWYPSDMLIDACTETDAKVVISSDCHNPEVLCDDCFRKLYAYALSRGLNIATTEEVINVIYRK